MVDDWIISEDTISYQIGCFICVNFADRTRIYNSNKLIHYLGLSGVADTISEESVSTNKNVAKKYRYYKSMMEAFDKNSE